MPSAKIKDSAYVPSEDAVLKCALEQARLYLQRPKTPREKFRDILDAARTLCDQVGAPYPPGIYHKKER